MKTKISDLSLILILAACGIMFIAGCATMQTENTPSLLSQAGFHARTPQTAKQKEYDALRLRPHPYEFAMYYDV